MLEIDVDVGRLQPLLGDKALEQQIDLGRIDRGDAEDVADGGIRRRSPALAQDVLAARVVNDVVHGEKIMRVFQLGDQRELLAQGGAQRVVDHPAKICVDAGPGQVFQMLLRGLARRHRLVRILISELVEREADAAGKAHGFRDCLRIIAKQPRHFMRRLEVAFGIGLQPPADGVDRGLLANAGEHILQRTARGMVVQHLVGREQRHPGLCRKMMQPRQPPLVIAAIDQARRQPHAVGTAVAQSRQHFHDISRLETMRQRQDEKLTFGKFQQVVQFQMAFALLDPLNIVAALAAGEELAEPAVSGAVARIDENIRRAVDEDEARTDQELWLVFDCGIVELLPGPHHAGQRIVVGNADHGNTQPARLDGHRRADPSRRAGRKNSW